MRTICAALLALLCAAPLHAQAPDRAADVDRIASAHRNLFTGDDGRRELLKVIVCDLNPRDGGNWGRLVKHDQGDKIPADILVWRPTREHFDVLSDTGPSWFPDGVLGNPAWEWSPVDCVSVPPQTPPPPPPPTGIDYSHALQELLDSQHALADSQHALADAQQQLLALTTSIDAHVTNMDRTVAQTLGSIGKFAAKYLAPAIAGYIAAVQLQGNTPAAAAPAK